MIQKIMNYDKRKSTITEQQVNAHKRRKIKLKKFMAEILLNLGYLHRATDDNSG